VSEIAVLTASDLVEVLPPPAARPFVQRLWAHRLEGPPPPTGRRLLPDGRIDLVWMAGVGVGVSGPRTRYLALPEGEHVLAFGASFHPGAAPYLLRTPASELVDGRVLLDAMDPRLASRLDDRLGHARDAREALAAFGRELSRRLAGVPPPREGVREAVRLLAETDATVAEAAARTFVSERALQRRFAQDVGYGPKTLQRVLRFQRFLRALHGTDADLAGAAALAGYADQSHLSRETRRLADLSPLQLTQWRH
jgi:AraC-like DNA-binding protein